MADQDDTQSRWVVEPPAAGQVKLFFDVGEGVELTPEVLAALNELVDALHGSDVGDVSGFATNKCPALGACPDFSCGSYFGCSPLSKTPCYALVKCAIG
jgi:hypothetical protein